jgi:hypothetical protein
MTDLTVIDKGDHCEIHQGDAIAADYVASTRLANLFAAAPELLAALQSFIALSDDGSLHIDGSPATEDPALTAARAAIAKAEGITTEVDDGKERSLD